MIIGEEKFEIRIKDSIAQVVTEEGEIETVSDLFIVINQFVLDEDIRPLKAALKKVERGVVTEKFILDIEKTNHIISKKQLLPTIKLPFFGNTYLPEAVDDRTDVDKINYIAKYRLLDSVNNVFYLPNTNIMKNISKRDSAIVFNRYINPVNEILNTTGAAIEVTIENRSNPLEREIIASNDENCKVSLNGSDLKNPAQLSKSNRFKRNIGNYLIYPGEVKKDDTLEYVLDFKIDPNLTKVTDLKICGFGEYELYLNGKSVLKSNFANRDNNLLIDNNLIFLPNNKLKVKLLAKQKIKLLNKPMLAATFKVGNDTIYTDSTWVASVSKDSGYKKIKVLSGNHIWYDQEVIPDKSNEFTRFFKKEIKVDEDKVLLAIIDKKYSGKFEVFLNGKKMNRSEYLRRGKNTILIKNEMKYFVPFNKKSLVNKVLQNRNILTKRTLRNPFKNNFEKRPLVMDRNDSILAYDININGVTQRMYQDSLGMSNVLGYFDHNTNNYIGLESTLKDIANNNPDKSIKVQLTINKNIQKKAIEVLKEQLKMQIDFDKRFNRNKETKEYLNHKKVYKAGILLTNSKGEILCSASLPDVNYENENDIKTSLLNTDLNSNKSGFFNINWNNRYLNGSTQKVVDFLAVKNLNLLTSIKSNDNRIGYISDICNRYLPNTFAGDKINGKINKSRKLRYQDKVISFKMTNHKEHVCPKETNIKQALSKSYNTYFSYLLLHLSNDIMSNSNNFIDRLFVEKEDNYFNFPLYYFLDKLGYNKSELLVSDNFLEMFGKDIDLSPLKVISSIYRKSAQPSQIINLAVGQEIIAISPIKQIKILSTIANNGTMIKPHLIRQILFDEKVKYDALKDKGYKARIFKNLNTEDLKTAMNDVSLNGTAKFMKYGDWYEELDGISKRTIDLTAKYNFYLKTGTASPQKPKYLNHSWIVGWFEKKDNPAERYYISCVFPYTRSTSSFAVRTIKKFIEQIEL